MDEGTRSIAQWSSYIPNARTIPSNYLNPPNSNPITLHVYPRLRLRNESLPKPLITTPPVFSSSHLSETPCPDRKNYLIP